jgi:hypothetical protein
MAGTHLADVTGSGGSRADIADKLVKVDAESTPLFSMIRKGERIDNMTFSYPINRLLAPKDSATPDAAEVKTLDNPNPDYAILSSRAQWNRRASGVSKLAQNVQNQAGTKNKLGEAKAAESIALKQDIECTLGDWTRDSVEGDTVAAYKTRSMPAWIKATAQTDLPHSTKYSTPSGQIDSTAMASFTEATVKGVLRSLFRKRKKKGTYTLVAGDLLKDKFADFRQTQFASTNTSSRLITYTDALANRKMENIVDVYSCEVGTLELMVSPWLCWTWGDVDPSTYGTLRGIVVDPEAWEIRPQQVPMIEDLPSNGAGPRFQVDSIWGLACLNPVCAGKFEATA